MAPTLGTVAERLYGRLEPITGPDEENGWALAILIGALGAMLQPIADLVSEDEDGVPGWASHLFSPDSEPAEWLPVSEWFAGVNPYPSIDEAGRRLRLKHVDGARRGTPGAIKNAARQFLVGPDGTPESATVFLNVRVGGVATDYTVATRASETPDADLVEAALLEQQPAGYNKTPGHVAYSVIVGGDYATLRDTHVDYADVAATFATYDDLRSDPSVT